MILEKGNVSVRRKYFSDHSEMALFRSGYFLRELVSNAADANSKLGVCAILARSICRKTNNYGFVWLMIRVRHPDGRR